MARIRTLNFLPEIFQTPTNSEFLSATLDRLVSNPSTTRVQGYIGSRLGAGINALDYYVTEPTKTRSDYQLEPGVVFTKEDESIARDFITYPGIVDSLKQQGAVTNNNNRLFNSQIYSWDNFSDLDKLTNYQSYYWVPAGLPAVTVSNSEVFTNIDYTVNNFPNTYELTAFGSEINTGTNPTISLLRGGTYRFFVDQDSQFFIQTEPGINGTRVDQPFVTTRDVFGVDNNGASVGIVTFNVPLKNAQDQFIFPGNNVVDVVSNLPFDQVNGRRLYSITDPSTGVTFQGLENIDGVTGLDGLRVMFFNEGEPDQQGFINAYYDETFYDVNDPFFTQPKTVLVNSTNSTNNALTMASGFTTDELIVNQTVTFSGTTLGGLNEGQVYFVKTIISATEFTISESLEGTEVTLFDQSGIDMTVNINQGQFEQGFYTTVNENFYRIQLVGDINNPVIRLLPDGVIPNNENIVPRFGTEYINRPFFRSTLGIIGLVPAITAPLDTLYYQDSNNPNKVGTIKIIENNADDFINVDTEILGKINYTSPNGVRFTNGLKVQFDGNIFPVKYKTGEYYVENVGNGIELIDVDTLLVPEKFSIGEFMPWDTQGFDDGDFDISLYLPVDQDYITVARNSISRNAWSRSNRWFHIDVINDTAKYNNNPKIATEYATQENKAKRPIIEFYPNLQLFNSGSVGKTLVDFYDTRTTDALSDVAGLNNYYPDVETYTTNVATVAATPTTIVTVAGSGPLDPGIEQGKTYIIESVIGTSQQVWNTIAGTVGVVYVPGDRIVSTIDGSTLLTPGTGTARLLYDETTITIPKAGITGTFQIGMFVGDTLDIVPVNSQIIDIVDNNTDITLTIAYPTPQDIVGGITSIVGTDTTTNNYAVFPGARIVFANDDDLETKHTVFVVDIVSTSLGAKPTIILNKASDSNVEVDQQVTIIRGFNYQGNTFYYDGIDWKQAQQKVTVNQAPLFDVFDDNGISFGDANVYNSTSFKGCTLFSYGINPGSVDDPILGFPIRFSDINNVGDISFDVTFNSDTFNYVVGFDSLSKKVNAGYVHNYIRSFEYTRELGWQTSVESSIQYQVFNFKYDISNPTAQFVCDVAALPEVPFNEKGWPRIKVYNNNTYIEPSEYTVEVFDTATSITLLNLPAEETVIQVLILSDQVSQNGYYEIPDNLNNNPFNEDLTQVDMGDIRNHYSDIFVNAPNTTGQVFGVNNYRDCGNLVPYGTKIIQNSASLVLPGALLRQNNYNLVDVLLFNSREYIKYKQLLVATVANNEFVQRFTPSEILDQAIEEISASKSEINSFFWSDMLPNKSPFRVNTYTFNSNNDVTRYPLSTIYNFESANYNGVLVYLNRNIEGNVVQKQLLRNVDYTVNTDSPTVTVTLPLVPGDRVIVKEYNQTYGSFVPYTPSKLGLYPLYEPSVVLDSDYSIPTYFIKGHDGSFTKLYGTYIPETDTLVDFRDQALLEFEKRIYNNTKLSTEVPIKLYDVLPGFFRDSDYSYDEWLQMYSTNFLNWVGQNRIDYKTQFYNRNNEFTYNYTNSGNKLNNAPILQGYWRGVYQYLFDTASPNLTPWEMLGFANKPKWWEERYGPAPYTSDNLVLWGDIEAGRVYSEDGTSVIVSELARPGLSRIIPVDSNGDLLSPLRSVVGNYNPNTFQKDWRVGDDGPAELSYRRSSSYPYDVIKLFALTKPAEFYNLAVDLDNYKFSPEFNQYLINNRSRLVIDDIEVYGDGIAKTSYINWVVDYEKQFGIDATNEIKSLLNNLDVRLIYRLAGYSDKTMMNFYVEKGSPNTANASLLIPDESYSVLLYDNQPFDKLVFSSVVVQKTTNGGYAVFGNSQSFAYFTTYRPVLGGKTNTVTVLNQKVTIASDHSTVEELIPYGTIFYSVQEVSQFIMNYDAYLRDKGMQFNEIQDGTEINWDLMVKQFLYWTQLGWDIGSIITLNPAATDLVIEKDGSIVQPLTLQQQNFILNQDLYPIQINNICVNRDGTRFKVHTLNEGDSMAFAQFNISNFEHGIVFNNTTLFNDVIYNLVTGLRQNRITLRGTKTSEWNGTVDAWGFIINQDNVKEWSNDIKYPKGTIVLYKNKYYTALRLIEPASVFNESGWKLIDYQDVQKGLLPNSATRSFESTLYYNCNDANLEQDADLLSYSLIGYRPRDYLALADLTDVTQINVYKNMIKSKGTKNAVSAFNNTALPQGEIKYDVYENWAIKSGDYGGVLSKNFVEFNLNEGNLTGNPGIVSLTNGVHTEGSQQEVPLYQLFNYAFVIDDPNVLATTQDYKNPLYPSAGYANFDDVKMSSYYYAGLPNAVDKEGIVVPIQDFYVRDYFWLANFKDKWGIFTWQPIGQVVAASANTNGTSTITFDKPHNLQPLEPIAIVNFSENVDGYYLVTQVVNLNQVTINLTIDNSAGNVIQGNGVGLLVTSQKVNKPGDIADLNLLEAEFIKNTVWVDEDTDGDWAVYRKSNNYVQEEIISLDSTSSFGYNVAYNDNIGYLVSDPTSGSVYRYQYNNNSEQYELTQTLTNDVSFGTKIVHADNTVVISQPTTNSRVYVYAWNKTVATDELFVYQVIDAPLGVTDWGTEVSISGNSNWIYISDVDNTSVYVYRKDNTEFTAPYIQAGETYIIDEVGDTDFTIIGATENSVGIVFVANNVGSGTGKVTRISYQQVGIIDGSLLGLTANDGFGKAIATDQDGESLFVSAVNFDFDPNITDWGQAYYYQRSSQTVEAQYTTVPYQPHTFGLGWTPNTIDKSVSSTDAIGNIITLDNTMDIAVDDAIVFVGPELLDTNIKQFATYYVSSINGNDITIKASRSTNVDVEIATVSTINTVTATIQKEPLYVTVNGTTVQDSNYAVINDTLVYSGFLRAGDIIEIGGNAFYQVQSFNASSTVRPNIQYGYDLDVTRNANELLIGSPLEIDNENREGLVYRYTNAGAKFGLVTGIAECEVTAPRNIFINGYLVTIPAGNASVAADAINSFKVANVQASATTDNRLIIQVIDLNLALANKKLTITAFDNISLTELGLQAYSLTQIINCPHREGPTEFGKAIKFNEHDSVVIGAPVGKKVVATTFDFTDDSNLDNDTVFDNNATRFVEDYANFGAAYMFDLLYNFNGSAINPGKFVYAQPVNNTDVEYQLSPYYGSSIDFNSNVVIVGAPNDIINPLTIGTVSIFDNSAGTKNWAEYRKSAPIVDIDKIQNTQIFSATTNNTLVNLDYIDPLQNKLLGVARENIDFVSNTDPAFYNNEPGNVSGYTWGLEQVGRIWFNTNNVRFVNYHQNDVIYNSEYWGTVFPGSDVIVCTWVASNVPPTQYQGPGIPLDSTKFSVGSTLNASNVVTPVYYFWARNTGVIDKKLGKTLADSVIAQYIENPKESGIAYMAPVLPNTFALYNSDQYINDIDSVFHVGYTIGNDADVSHSEFSLIRSDYADDFLPGLPASPNAPVTLPNRTLLPGPGEVEQPSSLYARLLDSLSGTNLTGAIIPDPFLPKLVQSGVLARPRQSFFYDRLEALKNYLTYANEILAQYPITELRPNLSFLFEADEYYDTANYWNYENWWMPGYNDATRTSIQVPLFADLSELNVQVDTIVRVEQNGQGFFEVYRYDGNGVWTRIGLENGTIQFKDSLWNYIDSNIGYSVDFFDVTPFDTYPSAETRNIVRALNEQIYIGDLLIRRNKSLTLLFDYIQSETIESQNYLPWLNKTSLADVLHTVRELKPFEVFKSDNVEFLEGYINEVKPYHVTIKEFLVKYDGIEEFTGDITDFDLPAAYNSNFQEFITPQLVYSESDNRYQYGVDNAIWSNPLYTQWYQNYGLSITGETNYNITSLKTYMDLGARTMVVDNASGFPANGVIKIGEELISYSFVDRDLNLLGGLSRGFSDSIVSEHIPGEEIFIDLPAVVILNEGSGYTNVPKITAVIDTDIYPAPRAEAEFQAIMSGDRVTSVKVINPGEGYATLPEIVIDPAYTVMFSDSDINSDLHTINLFAPLLKTGDIVRFNSGTNAAAPTKLVNNQWYYVGVLESLPNIIVALYNNYSDAIKDQNRIKIAAGLPANDMKLSPGARASIVTTSQPTRENNIQFRFDRTTYDSQVIDWETGAFYGGFFAGEYYNSDKVSSSAITLESTEPDINNILASAQGVALEIKNVTNDRVLTWSSFVRFVSRTIAASNSIELIPLDGNNPDLSDLEDNASGTTIGFYIDMPIKFEGAVAGNLQENQTYYVSEILDDIRFSVSDTLGGSTISLTDATISAQGLECYTGETVDTAILSVQYPGILNVTRTEAVTNTLTVPMTPVGTGGTAGFYTNLPVFFTNNVFGGIVENIVYYITTVIDNETFTISESTNPEITTVTETITGSDIVIVDSTSGFDRNDPIIVTQIDGLSPSIVSGKTYYVSEVISSTELTISEFINGPVLALTNSIGTGTITNQKNTVTLSSEQGLMTMNVSLPVSPGQIDGQLFTLYQTSGQFTNIQSQDYSNLINRQVRSIIGNNFGNQINRIAISKLDGGTDNFYVNMPVRFNTTIGNLVSGTTYYITEFSGMADPLDPEQTISPITVEVINTSSVSNRLLCTYDLSRGLTGTASLYEGMPIIFAGIGLGTIVIGQEYFVKDIISLTEFTISDVQFGPEKTLAAANGIMVGTGDEFIVVSATKGGSSVSLITTDTFSNNVILTQSVEDTAIFDISYLVGGYAAIISHPGEGYAVNNVITIPGNDVGGTSPKNDAILTVSAIDAHGGITSVIRSGTPAGTVEKYYLQVRSADTVAVYKNALLTIPASGIDLDFSGYTLQTVVGITNGDTLSVDTAGFNENDAVVFTGNVPTTIQAGKTYYLFNITSTTAQITELPNDIATLVTGIVFTSEFTMAKIGSIALLPEPFYFNQSIVRFNNRLYVCVVSNNDDEFVIGKWELLDSGDRRLNAMDRAIGYYQPTDNMPGVDLPQLFEGVEYPNTIYQGNDFQPSDQFALDTALKTIPFYPSDANITGITYAENKYLTSTNLQGYSAVLSSQDSENWTINKISNSDVGLSSISYLGGIYLMTSTNRTTPIFRSVDGITWTTTGYYIPADTGTYPLALDVAPVSLNAIGYCQAGQAWIAVGSGILRSTDTFLWNESVTFEPTLQYQLNGISTISGTNCQGLVAVGKGKQINTSTGIAVLEDINLFYYSSDSINWILANPVTDKGFFGVSSDGNKVIAVGESGVIYSTQNGVDWVGLNEVQVVFANSSTNVLSVSNAQGFVGGTTGTPVRFNKSFSTILADTTYYVKNVVSDTEVTLSDTLDGPEKTLTAATIPSGTRMVVFEVPAAPTLRDILFANNVWIAIGDQGTIKTSLDGIIWNNVTGFVNNLTSITFNPDDSSFTVVGENNTILTSFDNGSTWEETSIFTPEEVVYDIKGDPFTFGYAPEELVAGTVTDNLSLLVTTRPGTNWPTVEYGHSGFSVKSIELQPTSGTQVNYSFDKVVSVPIAVRLQILDGVTGLGTTLSKNDYSVNWVNKVVTLNEPLSFSPLMDTLLINVYEVGNGDQLVKASTDTLPIRVNSRSGFNEINLDCNYSAPIFQGSGVIRPGTDNKNVRVFETESVADRIFCEQVSDFTLNTPITFQGVPFGNLQEQTIYYVKTISFATNSITVSEIIDPITGLAGPTVELTDETGEMFANIQSGIGAVWSDPIVKHNGEKLVFGGTGLVTRSKADNNSLVTATTSGLIVGTPITFCQCGFGSLEPFRRYYIHSVINGIEFTVSETPGGSVLPQVDFVGSTTFITNDYSFESFNGNKAKLIFATNQYDVRNDYIAFSVFGETSPQQYNYSVPETQTLTGNGSSSLFTLSNFVGMTNPENAIVEVAGLRLTRSQYNIDPISNTILFSTPPALNADISITTYNDTDRQYLTSQFNVTGNPGSSLVSLTVSSTTNNVGTYDQDTPVVQTFDQDTPVVVLYDEFLNYLTLGTGTTSQLNINDPLIFSEPTLGGIVAGSTYYVVEIINSTDFVISEEVGGTPFVVFNDSGNMPLLANGLTVAPIQSLINTINPPLATTNATSSTTGAPNEITVLSTDGFVEDQPVQFFGTSFDSNIDTNGTVYFIESIVDGTTFTIKDFSGNQTITDGGTGNMLVEVGGNPTVRITTTIEHNLVENTLIRIDGLQGAEQLNNNLYYAKIISPFTFDIYTSPYDSSLTAVNNPILTVSTYIGGGYAWRQGLFFLETTTASETDALGNIYVSSAADLVFGTPVYFSIPESESGTILPGGLIQGELYYVNEVDVNANTFTVSSSRYGDTIPLLAETGNFTVAQWSQENVDRLYVTINGYRVPSSKLRINPVNEVSILSEIVPGDQVIITSMIPTATPNQETYINTVGNASTASVYRVSPDISTWTTMPLYPLADTLLVNDVSALVNVKVQPATAGSAVNGFYSIGLDADKNNIVSITVTNVTTGNIIDPTNIKLELISLSPVVKINSGPYINTGDILEITIVEGSILYINGEQIKFGEVDLEANSISRLTRGINGTARQTIIEQYSSVYVISPDNKLNDLFYSQVWNSNVYNPIEGDPLQISTTAPAKFLSNTDN